MAAEKREIMLLPDFLHFLVQNVAVQSPPLKERITERRMHRHRRKVVVVQTGAAQLGLGQVEAQRFDQVQFASRGRHHANRIAGVGRDTRLNEHHLEHDNSVARRRLVDRTFARHPRAEPISALAISLFSNDYGDAG